jgi:hypothetical protein
VLIVIGTSPDRSEWLAGSSGSIGREHIVVSNYGFELAKIAWVMDNTTAERFLFLQDSWVVKTPTFFTLLEQTVGSVALLSYPNFFGCYAGVYERSVIKQIGIPVVESKVDSVKLEKAWHESYVAVSGEPHVLFPQLTDKEAAEERFYNGRRNLILENEYVVKYKATWRVDQLFPI